MCDSEGSGPVYVVWEQESAVLAGYRGFRLGLRMVSISRIDV